MFYYRAYDICHDELSSQLSGHLTFSAKGRDIKARYKVADSWDRPCRIDKLGK
jgi:hypothetical protein